MARIKPSKTGKYHLPAVALDEKTLRRDLHKDLNDLVKRYTDEGVPRGTVLDIIHELSQFD